MNSATKTLSALRVLASRIRGLFSVRRLDDEFSEEIDSHFALLTEENIGNGMSPDKAARAARLKLGSPATLREEHHDRRTLRWLESMAQDVRFSLRMLRKNPGFTAVAVLTLVLGIGLNTTLFTLFNSLALRPWPVNDPARVVTLHAFNPVWADGYFGFGPAEYRYLRDHSRTMSGIFLMRHQNVVLDQQTDGARTSCDFVSGNYFSVLGVEMEFGRGFAENEDDPANPSAVVVLSRRLWLNRYGGDPQIIGRRILINDAPFMVLGVASAKFTGTSAGPHDIWVPYASGSLVMPNDPDARGAVLDASWCCSDAAGRMAPGVTREQAGTELTTLAGQYQASRGQERHAVLAAGTSLLGRPDHKRQVFPAFALLLGAVASVLLLACANVSNLLLARSCVRQQEISVRLAIGAGRFRLVRQLLTESLLLALAAGALSLLLAYKLPSFLLGRFAAAPVSTRLAPDGTVLAYTCAIALLAAIGFGLAPALRATRISLSDAMKRGTHSGPKTRLRSALLAVQVAISVVLLASAGLLAGGLRRAASDDLGFAVNGVAIVNVDLPQRTYDAARGRAFFNDLTEVVRSLSASGVVGLAATPPLSNSRSETRFTIPGHENERFSALSLRVDAGFFNALDIRFAAGRNFVAGDANRHAIIVNEDFARKFWTVPTAVGQTYLSGDTRYEIVGVTRDSQIYGIGPVEPISFSPFSGEQSSVLLLKGDAANSGWTSQIASTIKRREPDAVVSFVPMAAQVDLWLRPARIGATLAGWIGALALLLAAVGVYGVIAYSMEQRRQEIGLRVALGATRLDVLRFVLRTNSRALVAGLAAGLAISMATSRVLEIVLYQARKLDPLAYGIVLLVLTLAAIAAMYVPARRAMRVDPIVALRHE